MNIFKNKSIVAYLSLLVPVLAIVLAIIGGATKGLLGDIIVDADQPVRDHFHAVQKNQTERNAVEDRCNRLDHFRLREEERRNTYHGTEHKKQNNDP